MKSEKKITKKTKSKKWLLMLLLIVPFISIVLIIMFRHTYAPTNEEIIEDIKNISSYTVDAEYLVKNSKNEYKEETKMYYCKDVGMRIDFAQDRVKIYKDGFINVTDNGDKYQLEDEFDRVYPLGFYNNLLYRDIKEIKEGTEEWGDIKYLEVDVDLSGKNKHISSAKLYIDKANKSPIVTKIYDSEGKERVVITYSNFEKLKEMDNSLF